MRKLVSALILSALVLFVGCAKFWDQANANGGVLISKKAPYVVISQSGGEIMDVYVLPDAIVQASGTGEGWLFVDSDNRPVYLGGDIKTIRFADVRDPLYQSYHEYHMEHESLTYRQKFNTAPKAE